MTHRIPWSSTGVWMCVILGAAGAAFAQSSVSIDRCIRQLESDDFGERRAARSLLLQSGPAAVTALRRTAARVDDGALGLECISLLDRFTHHENVATAEQAQAALAQLSALQDSAVAGWAAKAAQPATRLLDSPIRHAAAAQFGVNGFGRGGLPARGLPPAGNGFRQAQIMISNGQRTIEVWEDQRQIRFSDVNGQQIQATLTEKQAGREITRSIEANDLTDLRQRDPELAAIFERHAQSIQVRAAAIPGR